MFHTLHTDSREHTFVHHGEDLTPTQSIKLMELVGQFADVLSFMPEMMHMVYHEIKMKPNGSIQLYNDFQKLNHGTSTATLSPVWMKWWSCLRHGLFPPSTSLLAAHISSGSKKNKTRNPSTIDGHRPPPPSSVHSHIPLQCQHPLHQLVRPHTPPQGSPGGTGVMAKLKQCHLRLSKAQYLGYHIGWALLKPQEQVEQAF